MIEISDVYEKTKELLDANSFRSSSEEKTQKLTENHSLTDNKLSFFDLFTYFQKFEMFLAYLSILLSSTQGILFPIFAAKAFTSIIRIASSDPSKNKTAFGSPDIWSFANISACILVTTFISCLIWHYLSMKITSRLKNKYFWVILKKKTEFFDTTNSNLLTTNFCQQVNNLSVVFSHRLHFYFMIYFQLLSGIVVSFYYSSLFSLVIFFMFPLLIVVGSFLVKSNQTAEKEMNFWRTKAYCAIEQSIRFFKSIKALNGEEHEFRNLSHVSHQVEKELSKTATKKSVLYGMFFCLIFFMFSLIMFVSFYLVTNEYSNPFSTDKLNLVDIFRVMVSLLPPLLLFTSLEPIERTILSAKISIFEIKQIMNDSNYESSNSFYKEKIRGHIKFENVTFSYPSNPDHPVLKNVSFEILPGQKIGIVGTSGSGKTTISQLLERFYDPQEGKIFIDGVDIRDFDLEHLRRSIGLVSQTPLMFSFSVRKNLILGSKTVDENKLLEVLEKIQMKDFIFGLPNGFETSLVNEGACLSNGQKQKLSISRTLLREPPILFFDEATGMLDKTDEREIQKIINEISSDKTAIHIAHKIETIVDSNLIIVFAEGRIVEQGDHDSLIKIENGTYRKLIELQNILDECRIEEEHEVSVRSKKSKNNIEIISEQNKVFFQKKAPFEINNQILSTVFNHKLPIMLIGVCICDFIPQFLYIYGCANVAFCLIAAISMTDQNSTIFSKNYQTMGDIQNDLYYYIKLLIFVSILAFFTFFSGFKGLEKEVESFVHKLRLFVYRRLLFKDAQYYDQLENKSDRLANTLACDLEHIRQMFNVSLKNTIIVIALMIVSYIICFRQSYLLGILTILLSVLIVFFKFAESDVMNVLDDKNNKANITLLSESVCHLRLVKSICAEQNLHEEFSKEFTETSLKNEFFAIYTGIVFSFSQILYYIFGLGIFFVSYQLGISNENNIRGVLVSQLIALMCFSQLLPWNENIFSISNGFFGLKRIFELTTEESEIEVDPTKVNLNPKNTVFKPKIKGKIEFRNVFFRHKGQIRNVLNGISFVIPAGTKIDIFGRTGSGKTTILELLLRFYDPSAGEILLDDINIKNFNLTYLRSIFGSFMQSPAIFNGSLRYNIVYNAKTTDEHLQAILEKAKLDEFAKTDPASLERILKFNGENISGGQKQRVSLARTLARPCQIFLFDEAISALDKTNETNILTELKVIWKEKTTIYFSTRAHAMKDAPRILVIENGMIIEEGTYEALMLKKGLFYRITK